MNITIRDGKEAEITKGSKLLVNCILIGKQKNGSVIVKVDGYFDGIIRPEVTLHDKSLAKKYLQLGKEVPIPCEVVLFHDAKPRVLFQGVLSENNIAEITLNKNSDILELVQT